MRAGLAGLAESQMVRMAGIDHKIWQFHPCLILFSDDVSREEGEYEGLGLAVAELIGEGESVGSVVAGGWEDFAAVFGIRRC